MPRRRRQHDRAHFTFGWQDASRSASGRTENVGARRPKCSWAIPRTGRGCCAPPHYNNHGQAAFRKTWSVVPATPPRSGKKMLSRRGLQDACQLGSEHALNEFFHLCQIEGTVF